MKSVPPMMYLSSWTSTLGEMYWNLNIKPVILDLWVSVAMSMLYFVVFLALKHSLMSLSWTYETCQIRHQKSSNLVHNGNPATKLNINGAQIWLQLLFLSLLFFRKVGIHWLLFSTPFKWIISVVLTADTSMLFNSSSMIGTSILEYEEYLNSLKKIISCQLLHPKSRPKTWSFAWEVVTFWGQLPSTFCIQNHLPQILWSNDTCQYLKDLWLWLSDQ